MSKVTEKLHSNKPMSVTFAYTETLTNQTGEGMGSTMNHRMVIQQIQFSKTYTKRTAQFDDAKSTKDENSNC